MNVHPERVDNFAPLRPQERAAIQPARGNMEGKGELVSPIPSDVPDPPETHWTLGKPSQVCTYRDASGETLFYLCRFDPHGERKQFLPLSLWHEPSDALRWRWKGIPAPRVAMKAARWVADNADAIRECDPNIPDAIFNRAADNWAPLLAVAEVACSVGANCFWANPEWLQAPRKLVLRQHLPTVTFAPWPIRQGD